MSFCKNGMLTNKFSRYAPSPPPPPSWCVTMSFSSWISKINMPQKRHTLHAFHPLCTSERLMQTAARDTFYKWTEKKQFASLKPDEPGSQR